LARFRTKQPILLNQRVAKILPVEADLGFVWSVVSSQEYQEKFFYLADGAAQPNMSGGQIEGLEIPCPPLPVQRRIAGILSAYDETDGEQSSGASGSWRRWPEPSTASGSSTSESPPKF